MNRCVMDTTEPRHVQWPRVIFVMTLGHGITTNVAWHLLYTAREFRVTERCSSAMFLWIP